MFETLLLGHLVGDYLLQNEWMAMNKTHNTRDGWIAALTHCLLYTFAVCLIMWNFHWIWIVAVFFSHFPIDKFGLSEMYLHYIKGKGMKDYVKKDNKKWGVPHIPLNRYDALEGGFTAVVYTITDNTMHLLLMYFAYHIIY